MKRLKLNDLKLYGREKELSQLVSAYEAIQRANARAQVVLVHGVSGSGKTAIVHQLRDQITNAIFVSGKFDQRAKTNAKPFSALVDAFAELFGILQALPQHREHYQRQIRSVLRNEWKTVALAVPALASFWGEELEANERKGDGTVSIYNTALNRLKLKALFRALLGALSASPDRPLVFFLDDLQFSDEASIDLIQSLLMDQSLQNLLFIATYRDDEVDATDSPGLTRLIQEETKRENCTAMAVPGLDVRSINELLADAMTLRPEQCQPLAQVVMKKTRGNIFFTIQFLKAAQQKELLYFSSQSLQWTWDLHKLESETSVSHNVVELLLDRLNDFSPDVRYLLSIASCLGAQFNVTLLATLYENRHEEPQCEGFMGLREIELATEELERETSTMLHAVEKQELITTGDAHQIWMFAHDRIQQASYLLTPEGPDKRMMELRIGLQLLRLFRSPVSQRWMLFAAVNNVNRSSGLITTEEKMDLARLNLETAKRAQLESAFLLAAAYLRKGIELLDAREDTTSTWTDHYSLTFELHALAAEMEYTAGNCKKAKSMASDLIQSNLVQTEHKMPLYFTLMRAEGDQANLKLALETGSHALHTLGVSIPKNPSVVSFLWYLFKTDKKIKEKTDEELLNLPELTDEKKRQAATFMRPMMLYCWALNHEILLSIMVLKGVRLALRYGYSSESTPFAFGVYGLVLASLGRTGDAFRYGELALRFLEKDSTGMIGVKTHVMVAVHAFCSHWRRPLMDSLDPLLDAHRTGLLENGDAEWSCQAASTYCGLYLNTGLPLEPFTADGRKIVQTMKDFDQEIALVFAVVPNQVALNLMGRSKDPLVLTGEAMDEQKLLQELTDTSQKIGLFFLYLHQMILNYVMGEADTAHKHGSKMWALNCKTFKGHFVGNEALFFSGLAEFAVARKHGRRKPPRRAMKHLQELWGHEKEGGVNQHPMRLILEAEAATFSNRRNDKEVQRMYDQAIATAMRSGLTQMAAISNEQAAEFMISTSGGDHYWPKAYLENARDCYNRWGATAKVAQLESKYPSFLALSTTDNTNDGNLRGVERVSEAHQIRGLRELFRQSTARSVSTNMRSRLSEGSAQSKGKDTKVD